MHTCKVAIAKFNEIILELLPHPSFFSDQAPSESCLFPNLNKWVSPELLRSNDELFAHTNFFFENLDQFHYLEGITKLEKHWRTVLSSKEITLRIKTKSKIFADTMKYSGRSLGSRILGPMNITWILKCQWKIVCHWLLETQLNICLIKFNISSFL